MDFTEGTHTSEVKIKWQYQSARLPRHAATSANWKLTAPGYVACPQCHEPKMPHHVCPECGYYDGKEVVKAAE